MTDNQTLQLIQHGKKALLTMGLLMVLTGVLAIVFPVVSSLAVNYFVGGLLMFVGILQFIGAFSVNRTQSFFGALLIAVLTLAAGTFIVFNPLAMLTAITIILAILFIIEGIFHIMFAFEVKPNGSWGWLLFSGIISIALGLILASGLSTYSLIFLGILLGVNFLSTGLAFLILYHQLGQQ